MKESLLFGIIQGLPEFLPVSSSGHLFIAEKLMPRAEAMLPVFVLLHLATLFSVAVFFRKEIAAAFKNRKMIGNISLVTVVTLALAFIIEKTCASFFGHSVFISAGLLVTSLLLLFIRRGGQKSADELTLRDCIVIGFCQGLAAVPGISRSGMTITVLMKRGFRKEDAFSFSFLLSIPVIAAAFVYEAGSLRSEFLVSELAAGFLTAFLAGLFALKMLKKYVSMNRLYYFGCYCLVLAGAVLFIR